MPKKLVLCSVVFFVLVGVCSCILESASADSVVLNSVRDNTLYDDPNALSNGAGDFFFAGRNGGGAERRGLLLFDLSPFPLGATIESVSLELTVSQANSVPADIGVHRLLSDWGESSSDANGGEGAGIMAEVGDATWQHTFYPGSLWNNPGGDFDGAASATQTLLGPAAYTWQSSGLVFDVQNWVNGSVDNFGWALVADSLDASSAKRFNSRENGSGSPILRIEFSVVPEPSCVLLLSALCCASVVRRRK